MAALFFGTTAPLTLAGTRPLGMTAAYTRPRRARLLTETETAPHTRCARAAAGCSEQVHLALGGPGEMVVSWATDDDATPSTVAFWGADGVGREARGRATAYSQLLFLDPNLVDPEMGQPGATEDALRRQQDTRAWAHDPWTGRRGDAWNDGKKLAYGLAEYSNPAEIYNSPVLHSATLARLAPGATYGYRVAGDARNFSFTTPPAPGPAFPLTLGLTADLGQTAVSAANVDRLRELLSAAQPHAGVVLLAGDLSYADGYYARWDSFGRMVERLAAEVPLLTTGGNHEIGNAEAWVGYHARYPMPHAASGSVTNMWWAADIGPAHVVSLCSYAATAPGSLQYRWLERHLATVDRDVMPWLLVMMHAPWYNSNAGHVAEAELMRRHMEPLLYRHGVDLVLSGHVHAYERFHPTYKGERNPCGPVYLNLGDGGNREGAYIPWLEPQPSFSAFREGSFGIGALRLVNATHAAYNWSRSACEGTDAPDHINFDSGCASRSKKYKMRDNAEHPYLASDEVWLERKARRVGEPGCAPEETPGAAVLSGPQAARLAPEPRPVLEAGGAARTGTLGALLLGVLGGVLGLLFAQRLARSSRAAAARGAQRVDPNLSVVLDSAVLTGAGCEKGAAADLVELNAGGVDSATGAARSGVRATSRGGGPMQL